MRIMIAVVLSLIVILRLSAGCEGARVFAVTIGQDEKALAPLRCTVEATGIPLHVLEVPVWRGGLDKMLAMLEHMKTLDPDDIIVQTDGYDVVAAGCTGEHLAGILDFYGSEVVIGGESGWYKYETQPDLAAFFDTPLEHRHPNSGCYLATVRGMTRFLDVAQHMHVDYDDQVAATRAIMAKQLNISIDAGQLLCSNTWGHERDPHEMVTEEDPGHSAWYEDSFEERDGRIFNGITMYPTCFIHDNGHRTTLPLPDGRSWWRHELIRRCMQPHEPVSEVQLAFHSTPPHGGSRTISALCAPPRCTRQADWREPGKRGSNGTSVEQLYGPLAHVDTPNSPLEVITFNADRRSNPSWDASTFINPLLCTAERMRAAVRYVNVPGEEHTNESRMKAVLRWLNRPGLDTQRVVLFLDAWDTVILSTANELLMKFGRFQAGLVISAERGMWPRDCDAAELYPPTAGAFRYINSGGYIGHAGSLREAFKTMAGDSGDFRCPDVCGGHHDDTDDMRCFHWLWKRSPPDMRVDHNASIFFSMDNMGLHELRGTLDTRRIRPATTCDRNSECHHPASLCRDIDSGNVSRCMACDTAIGCTSVGGHCACSHGDNRVRFRFQDETPCIMHANGNGKDSPRVNFIRQVYTECFEALPQYSVSGAQLRV